MSSISGYKLDLHSDYEYKYKCSLKSIEILDNAIYAQLLPTRCTHSLMICKEVFPRGLFEVIKEIVLLVRKAFSLLCLALSCNVPQKKEKLLFAAIELLLLQPLSIIVAVARTIMRIVFLFSGIFVPSLAVKGYKWSEQVNSLPLYLRAILWKKIAPTPPHDRRVYHAYHNIHPEAAINYLGRYNSKEIQEQINLYSERHQELKAEIGENLSAYLGLLSTQENLFKLIFSKFNNPYSYHHEYYLPYAISSIQSTNPKDIIDAAKKLEPEEIKRLFDFINYRLSCQDARRIIINEENGDEDGGAEGDPRFAATLNRHKDNLHIALLEKIGYGGVRYPVVTCATL